MCLQYKQQFMNTIIRTVYIRRPCKYSNNVSEYFYNDVWPTQPIHICEYCCFIISHKWLYTCARVCVWLYMYCIYIFSLYFPANINLYISVSQTMRLGGSVPGEDTVLVALLWSWPVLHTACTVVPPAPPQKTKKNKYSFNRVSSLGPSLRTTDITF